MKVYTGRKFTFCHITSLNGSVLVGSFTRCLLGRVKNYRNIKREKKYEHCQQKTKIHYIDFKTPNVTKKKTEDKNNTESVEMPLDKSQY